ncbi:hypothetical protein D3OALGB2SA_1184 [Olavius algarvensis associated proteobacterium Delta 3]|nr:hypothetical protein D3OALGB2SA_1184 [Olavius algarvensis associated proteobacterium Delta 3]
MSGTGKVFRMATVNAEKPQIDMRYSNADGMWYPSQPAPLASGSDAVFVNKDSETHLLNPVPISSTRYGVQVFVTAG